MKPCALVLTKGIPDERIIALAAMAGEAGVEKLKMYVILGMPHSDESEVDQLILFLPADSQSLFRRRRPGSEGDFLFDQSFCSQTTHAVGARGNAYPKMNSRRGY